MKPWSQHLLEQQLKRHMDALVGLYRRRDVLQELLAGIEKQIEMEIACEHTIAARLERLQSNGTR